jgi:hypothetical protein
MSDFKIVKLLDPIQINVNINPRGEYDNLTTYNVGDLVTYNGLSYIAKTTTVGNLPTDTNYWQLVVNLDGAWKISGNTGINPATDFLGTTDNNPLIMKTNSNQIAQFDVNGRFAIGSHQPLSPIHIKPYSGYSGSGYRLEPFAVTTNQNTPAIAYTFTMTNGQVVRVKYQVTGRLADGSERCSFTRSALFYRESANVAIQGRGWQSDFTSKSDNDFDVGYTLGPYDINFTVTSSSTSTTYWVGHVEIEVVSTSI